VKRSLRAGGNETGQTTHPGCSENKPRASLFAFSSRFVEACKGPDGFAAKVDGMVLLGNFSEPIERCGIPSRYHPVVSPLVLLTRTHRLAITQHRKRRRCHRQMVKKPATRFTALAIEAVGPRPPRRWVSLRMRLHGKPRPGGRHPLVPCAGHPLKLGGNGESPPLHRLAEVRWRAIRQPACAGCWPASSSGAYSRSVTGADHAPHLPLGRWPRSCREQREGRSPQKAHPSCDQGKPL